MYTQASIHLGFRNCSVTKFIDLLIIDIQLIIDIIDITWGFGTVR